jgi:membrane protease YdiL (CAAX protease family)
MTYAIHAICLLTAGFVTYHFLIHSNYLEGKFLKKWGEEKGHVFWIYFQRLLGMFVYGVIPAGWLLLQKADFQEYGIAFRNGLDTLCWTARLGMLVILISYFAAKTPANRAVYPQIRIALPWKRRMLWGSALTWSGYLLAYEFLFRGYLLFSCERVMGSELAIVVNVAFYSLVHVPKGWKETIGAIPLGIVLCLLTLRTETIWIAFGVHVAMALSNEWFSLYFNRQIEVRAPR